MVAKLIEHLKKKDWHYEKRKMLFHEETRQFAKAFKENFTTLMITAFGLTAGLMWQDALKTFINSIIPVEDPNNFMLKTIVALFVTLVAIIGIFFMSKLKTQNGNSHGS